jgi:hypothetical protein
MFSNKNGVQIQAELCQGRPWWELNAADIEPWMSTWTDREKKCRYGNSYFIGKPWNRTSILHHQAAHMNPRKIEPAILEEVLRRLYDLVVLEGMKDVKPITVENVRIVNEDPSGYPFVVIDIQFDRLIVPILIDPLDLRHQSSLTIDEVVAMAFNVIKKAYPIRFELGGEDISLRMVWEAEINTIGYGIAPIWFRRQPVPIYQKKFNLNNWPRCLAAIAFDHTLGWGLIGDDSVSSVTAIKRAVKWTQSECASNAKVALEHQAS